MLQGLIFSEEDADLYQEVWKLHKHGYAYRGKRPDRLAHRIVLQRKIGRRMNKGELTDHINRNKLDNRRENLRIADKSLNTINRDLRPDNTTGYVGVYLYWPKEYQQKGWAKLWSAQVFRNGRAIYLGYFSSPELASQARLDYLNL